MNVCPDRQEFTVCPRPPAPPVPAKELGSRLQRLRNGMEHAEIDAIVLTDKKNIDYLTDYRTLSWAYKARPLMLAISQSDVALIGSLTEANTLNTQTRTFSLLPYDGYLPEAIAAMDGWVRTRTGTAVPTLAIDYGQDMFGRGSLELIDALNRRAKTGRVGSAADLLWQVRLIKSPFEAEQKRAALAIVNEAFDETIARARIGMSEFELCQLMQAQIHLNGAESADPIAMLFSRGDFAYGRLPSKRVLEYGHYVWTDFRATYGGYPADRNRIARAGQPADWEIDLYSKVRSLTIDLAQSIRVGETCGDVHRRFVRMWREAELGKVYDKVSRIGHGGGLDVTEPPSIAPNDPTVIAPGMILHLEPKLEQDGAVFQFEEVIYVRQTGAEFLSALSPKDIPVVSE